MLISRLNASKVSFQAFALIILLFFLAMAATGCQSNRLTTEGNHLLDWNYSDLRILDPIDAPNPDQDLIAVYARNALNSFQVRLDFLDLEEYLGKDIYILMDTNPGGSNQIVSNESGIMNTDITWDYMLEITDSGIIRLTDSLNSLLENMQIFIVYDSVQDQIVVDFLSPSLPIYPSKTKLKVIVTLPGTTDISDISRIFRVDEPPPPRAQVNLAFWNTFAAVSPAQTLRSWAGAHTGPFSSRHGLSYLLEQAERTDTPVSLFDLYSNENISGLDYLGQLGYINRLINSDILFVYSDSSNKVGDLFSFIRSNIIKEYMGNNDYAQFKKIDQCNLQPKEVDRNQTGGLTTSCKALFITKAIDFPSSPLYLGGDFSKSVMGDSTESVEIFGYFATHPWLQVVGGDEIFGKAGITPIRSLDTQSVEAISDRVLKTLPGESLASFSLSSMSLYDSLLHSSENKITTIAWQVFHSLTQAGSEDISTVRTNYIGQIGELIAASNWSEVPKITQACNLDLDYDGIDECILANAQIFLVIEPDGGYIPFMFHKDSLGIHQVIGPSWQFIVGLSDPMAWDASLGVRGDPAQILGALQDSFASWNMYKPETSSNAVTLSNNDGSIRKSISITGNTVQISYDTNTSFPANIFIPLVIDPWFRFTRNWGNGYLKSDTENAFSWGILDGEMVTVKSNSQVLPYSFIDSRAMMSKPEDPNYDYPRGHYLPFPMAVVEIPASENLSIEISISP